MALHIVRNKEQLAEALSAAVASDPELADAVFDGLLRLIAEFVPYVDAWAHHHKNLRVSREETTVTALEGSWSNFTAYGADSVAHGRRTWHVRIDKDKGTWSCIGVARDLKPDENSFWASWGNGYCYRIHGDVWNGSDWLWGVLDRANESDVVAVELDLDAKTLSFRKNGALLGGKPAITEVAPGTYCLAVTLRFKDDGVTIIK